MHRDGILGDQFDKSLKCLPSLCSDLSLCSLWKKETIGVALLTIETEVNGDSKRTNERGPSFVGSLGLPYRYKRFLFCLTL